MKLSQLLTRLETKGNFTDCEISSVTDKFDAIRPGDVFVCIKGNRFDAHTVAKQAIEEKGAAAVIVERETGAKNEVIVENSRKAYSFVCSEYFGRPTDSLKMVGITGTNGKTTVSFLIKDILETAGKKCGLLGTVVNLVGDKVRASSLTTPDPFEMQMLFREMVDDGCEFCIMEVSSQALSQQRVAPVTFDVGIFTNLTQDHLDYHGTMENYKNAKHMLFENCKKVIINDDDDAASFMKDNISAEIVTYSMQNDSDYTAKNPVLSDKYVAYELVGNAMISRIRLNIPGEFSVYNSMAAAVCAKEMGIEMSVCKQALSTTAGVKGRMETVPVDTPYTVIIDYAHSPDGLINVLKSLRKVYNRKIITVFGCGGDRDKTKRPIMGQIAGDMSDVVVVTSDNPRTEDPQMIIDDILAGMEKCKAKIHVECDRTTAIEKALSIAQKDDVVLLAGKGHETYQILNSGKIHYDEREIVKGILSR
ncbi:MAG: UDP-N-acetylmuramoyl-L-alanyl-D-glutamate--2,6-diaminopimelate ligase [Clostridia bacterium]|nr:UDP-N-acetylmuramoyl-L-alanyl-D-glutamate--2,6-diaminopimelate ligase [Clostridia bacterium]